MRSARCVVVVRLPLGLYSLLTKIQYSRRIVSIAGYGVDGAVACVNVTYHWNVITSPMSRTLHGQLSWFREYHWECSYKVQVLFSPTILVGGSAESLMWLIVGSNTLTSLVCAKCPLCKDERWTDPLWRVERVLIKLVIKCDQHIQLLEKSSAVWEYLKRH